MNLVHNERIKLVATALNNLGVGSIVGGFIGPAVNGRLGSGQAAATIAWIAAGIILHSFARGVLGELRE